MRENPRDPRPEVLVPTDSQHEFHRALRKTLVLLRIETKDDPIYFVVEGLAEWSKPRDEMLSGAEYFYTEHTCPTNFIRIPMISVSGDHDPHGVFEFIDAVWMTTEYEEAEAQGRGDDYLVEVFPQMIPEGVTIDNENRTLLLLGKQ